MNKVTKNTIKFLTICKEISIKKQILQKSSNLVIKSICNAALNAASGDIGLNKTQIHLFQSHKKSFEILLAKSISISNKKSYLIQNKNNVLHLLSPLLSVVLDSIGTQFIISNDHSIQKVCVNKSYGAGAPKGEEDS